MQRTVLTCLTVIVIASAANERPLGQTSAVPHARQMPIFQVDAQFFRPLPNNWVTGQGSAVAVDKHDHAWVFHRPRYVPSDKKAAPPVLEFDASGKFVRGWGGPGEGYDWPDQEHGIYVDDEDNVWLTGSARPALTGPGGSVLRSDNMVLKFTNRGKFVMQIGHRDQSDGNADTKNVYSSTDLSVYPKTREVFVADGYINHRVIVFDATTGAFKRMWGAFGNVPMDSPDQLKNARTPARARGEDAGVAGRGNRGGGRGAQPPRDAGDQGPQQFVGPVHSAKVSNDGLVYVADRSGNRLQVFTVDGRYVKQTQIESPSGLALSLDPEQRFLYIAQYAVSHVAVLDRQTLDLLYQFGTRSETPGDFRGPHELAVDSKGNLYVAEVEPGNRVQKFVFKGLSQSTPANALTSVVSTAPQQSAAGATLFAGARLITDGDRAPIEDSAFLIEGDKITKVGRRSEVQAPAGAARVDLTGKTVIPALINVHGHVGFQKGPSFAKENYTRENILNQLNQYAYYGVGAVMTTGTGRCRSLRRTCIGPSSTRRTSTTFA